MPGGKRTQIGHYAVLPDKRAWVPARQVSVYRPTNHVAAVIDGQAGAVDISRKGAEVPYARLFGPQEGVSALVAGQCRDTSHLTSVIDSESSISDR